MTEEQARKTANFVMAAAALGAAVFVLRNPKLRRLAWRLAREYAGGPLAAVVAGTVRNAWDASGGAGDAPLPRAEDARVTPDRSTIAG